MSMGVYIKGMEMPEKTYAHCMLIKDIDGSVQLHVCTKNSEEISEWEFFDLVHVPPHGDLIDRDALRDNNCDAFEINGADGTILAMDVSIIDDAPTIIEAEEGET